MSKARKPKYCGPHNPSGKGYAWLNGKQIYFKGRHNSRESLAEYRKFLSENFPDLVPYSANRRSVKWVIRKWREEHEGQLKYANMHHYKQCFKVLKEAGVLQLEAARFSPKILKVVRNEMIVRGWAMATINERVGRIKTMFKWAASEELVPKDVAAGLYCVSGLRASQGIAPAPRSRRAVSWEEVEAIGEHLSPTVIGMCRLQWLTGMRSENLCDISLKNVSKVGDVWLYRPVTHKNLWRGKGLAVAIGPEGQKLIMKHLAGRDEDDYVFRPIDSVMWHALRSEKGGYQKTREYKPCFTASTMRQAVIRAQARAAGLKLRGKLPTVEEIAATGWKVWTPYQLRHAAITRLALQFPMEMVKAYMGHASVETTYLYSDHNLASAKEIALKCG